MTEDPHALPGDIITRLQSHAFLQGFSDSQFAALASMASLRTCDVNEFIAKDGESADSFTLVCAGQVAIEIHVPKRGVIRIQTIGPGDVVGWSWLIPPHRWQFDATVVQTAELIDLDASKLRTLCDSNHEIGYPILKRLVTVIAARLGNTRLQSLDVYR